MFGIFCLIKDENQAVIKTVVDCVSVDCLIEPLTELKEILNMGGVYIF